MDDFQQLPKLSGARIRSLLSTIEAMGGSPELEALAERLDTSSNELAWYLQQLELNELVDFKGPSGHRVMEISPDGRRALLEGHDLFDRRGTS